MDNRIDPQDVLRVLGISIPAQAFTTGKFDIDCPFCGDRKKHLNINISKGMFFCRKCAEGGSVVQLYGKLQSPPLYGYREIRDELRKELGTDTRKEYWEKLRQPIQKKAETPLADIQKRDKAYRALLSICSLSQEHRLDLMKRGLTFSDTLHAEYKTTPNIVERQDIPDKVMQISNLQDLKGVPGFYLDKRGKWAMKYLVSGYFIPYLDCDGHIQGMQIRCDPKAREGYLKKTGRKLGKYIWLTSANIPKGGSCGTTVQGFVHVSNAHASETMILTEGGLKADVAHSLMDGKYGIMAIPGVLMTKMLPEVLDRLYDLGTRNIVVALDMDMHTNTNVLNACKSLITVIRNSGMKDSMMQWEQEKGIDDFLLARQKNIQLEIHEIDTFL